MNKAVIIGGSNGIGLAIALKLLSHQYSVEILDIVPPDAHAEGIHYTPFNLLDQDRKVIEALANDHDVKLLMLTAGIGYVTKFENLHPGEIRKLIEIDLGAQIEIIRQFYGRIKDREPFYCGVMGSIAGLVCSPLFSVYAAAKAGIARFAESVNIELEEAGTSNRILHVAPVSFKGTRFSGGENDLSLLGALPDEIIMHLFNSEAEYFPQYDGLVKGILERNREDAHAYGLYSYDYKMKSGRVAEKTHAVIGYLSGTFDLFHVGHLNLLRKAKGQCDYLIVGVHSSGKWKGKETFIPFEERKEILRSCKYVDQVVDSCVEDSDAWDLWHFNRLFVGSDYQGTERFKRYEEYFRDKGVKIVYFPYTKGTSSTQIREKINRSSNQGQNEGKPQT